MKVNHWLWLATLFLPAILIGCKDAAPEKPPPPKKAVEKQQSSEDEVKTNLAKLDPEDRKLAEAQRFCAVENESRLGSMGTPFKVLLNDQAVFLCCKGCRKRALAEPEKTVAKVESLRKKSAEPPAK